MIFKICGLKNEESLICCEKNNVDFFGIIFYDKSPRNISINEAKRLTYLSVNLKIKPVGVFVNHNMNELKKIIFSLGFKYIQLHGDENQEYIDELKNTFEIKIIRKISINTTGDLDKIKDYNNIDYLLFDYKPEINELPGGNSKTFDWSLLQGKKFQLPWFISGGVNATNIKNIQNTINPNGIDLSSGVEELKGIKSNRKINSLFNIFYDN